jgi:hypothetical protein
MNYYIINPQPMHKQEHNIKMDVTESGQEGV